MESEVGKFKVRASELGDLMTESRKKGELSETAKAVVLRQWLKDKYGYEERIYSDAMRKGTEMEEPAIALYNQVVNDGVKRINSDWRRLLRLQVYYVNDYLHGTPDIITDTHIEDVKCSLNLRTFFTSELTKSYEYQLRAYMWLTGRKAARLVYAMLPDPDWMLQRRLRNLEYQVPEDRIDDEQKHVIEQNRIIATMPVHDRIRVFEIEHDDEIIERIKQRIEMAGEYYLNLNETK